MILRQFYDLALWPHPWHWPWSFKVRVWNSFISGMGQPIDNERKGCESSIHDHDIDLCDHGGWADVPDSDRGDFRRRRAVDVSSCFMFNWTEIVWLQGLYKKLLSVEWRPFTHDMDVLFTYNFPTLLWVSEKAHPSLVIANNVFKILHPYASRLLIPAAFEHL